MKKNVEKTRQAYKEPKVEVVALDSEYDILTASGDIQYEPDKFGAWLEELN